MTTQEKIIVTAHTGVIMCEMDDLLKYAREKLGRPVWKHELAFQSVVDELQKAAEPEFLLLAMGEETISVPAILVSEIKAEIEALRKDAKMAWDAGEADRHEGRADALEWVLGRLTGEDIPRSWAHYN